MDLKSGQFLLIIMFFSGKKWTTLPLLILSFSNAKWYQIILYENDSYNVHNVLRKGLVQLSLQYKAW